MDTSATNPDCTGVRVPSPLPPGPPAQGELPVLGLPSPPSPALMLSAERGQTQAPGGQARLCECEIRLGDDVFEPQAGGSRELTGSCAEVAPGNTVLASVSVACSAGRPGAPSTGAGRRHRQDGTGI